MKIVFAALLALALGACVTVSNTLSPEQVRSFRLAAVEVTVPPGAVVSWDEGLSQYDASKGIAHDPFAAPTPEAIAFQRDAIAGKVRTAFEGKLRPRLTGTRPVRVVVTVRNVTVASPAQRVLIGGNHVVSGDVTVLDAKTGSVLSNFPAQTTAAYGGSGIIQTVAEEAILDRPVDRAVDRFATVYQHWLVPGFE